MNLTVMQTVSADSRNSETQEWAFECRSRFQISHWEKFEKAKLSVGDSLYPRIVRNARNGEERTRQDQGQSNQIRPNQTNKPNQTGVVRTDLDFGRARWMRGNAERMNGKAKCLSDRNTFFIYDTDERGLGLGENLRLSSLILAYSRLFSLIFA